MNKLIGGLLAGAAGVAAMTLAEKLEQQLTRRPDSYIPAHTLQRLLQKPMRDRLSDNWAMHWGQGILLGPVRSWMAGREVRGPFASFLFLNLRLLNDQTLENITGAGALPWAWPACEQGTDIVEKAVYAFVTGAVADWIIPAKAQPENQRGPLARQNIWVESTSEGKPS